MLLSFLQLPSLSRPALRDCMDGALKIELNSATRVPNEDVSVLFHLYC